jgi:hypothetical protein
MLFHIDLSAAEAHAFGFKAKALFHGGIAAQLDFSACTKDAMPGQVESAMQYLDDLARHSWKAGGSSNCSVCGNLTAGNIPNRGFDKHPSV